MSDTIVSLLHDIVEVGDRLCTAITTRQMDAIHDCLEERAELLVQLEQYEDVLSQHPKWDAITEELAHQHERIQRAFDEYKTDIETELEELNNYREAQSAYHEPDRPSRQILKREVRG